MTLKKINHEIVVDDENISFIKHFVSPHTGEDGVEIHLKKGNIDKLTITGLSEGRIDDIYHKLNVVL